MSFNRIAMHANCFVEAKAKAFCKKNEKEFANKTISSLCLKIHKMYCALAVAIVLRIKLV